MESEDSHRDGQLAENTEFSQCINVAQQSIKKVYGISKIDNV